MPILLEAGYPGAPPEAEATAPTAMALGSNAVDSQIAASLLASKFTGSIPAIITLKPASASSSLTFFAIVKPSHHKVVAGACPVLAIGAAANFTSPTTFDSSALSIAPALDAHKLAIAIFPCWNCFCTYVESEVKYSGSMYPVNFFINFRVS